MHMSNKLVLVLGTAARGGIQSVIQAYEKTDFYKKGNMEFIKTHVDGGFIIRFITALIAFWKVFIHLVNKRVSVLHMHMSMRGSFWRKFILLNMSRIAGIPTIIHLHGSEFSIFYQNSSKIVKKLIRYQFNKADGIVVLSNYWKVYLEKITNNKVHIICNYVPDTFNPDLSKKLRNRNKILFLGEFGDRKGIYDLITAFKKVLIRVPKAKLYCGGNGEVENVRQIVKELDLERSIFILGWVSGAEKNNLVHECGIFALPSYNEGLPMAIIEALSYSMAVVSTSVGGIPELVSNSNGKLIEPGNIEQLSDALIEILSNDDDKFKLLCEESRKRYEKYYSPTSGMAKMKQVYHSLGVDP